MFDVSHVLYIAWRPPFQCIRACTFELSRVFKAVIPPSTRLTLQSALCKDQFWMDEWLGRTNRTNRTDRPKESIRHVSQTDARTEGSNAWMHDRRIGQTDRTASLSFLRTHRSLQGHCCQILTTCKQISTKYNRIEEINVENFQEGHFLKIKKL